MHTTEEYVSLKWSYVAPSFVGSKTIYFCLFFRKESFFSIHLSYIPSYAYSNPLAILCLFVFLDVSFIVYKAIGEDVSRAFSKYILGEEVAKLDGHQKKARRLAKKKMSKTSTKYAGIGSSLGLLFFLVGPLMSLVEGDQISCPVDGTNVGIMGILNGEETTSSFQCATQRSSYFILQLLFNVIFYSMLSVQLIVTDRMKSLSSRTKGELSFLLYNFASLQLECGLFPSNCTLLSYNLYFYQCYTYIYKKKPSKSTSKLPHSPPYTFIHPFYVSIHTIYPYTEYSEYTLIYTHTNNTSITPIQTIHPYNQYTHTNNTPIQTIHPYKQYTHTNNTPIQTIHPYKQYTHPSNPP